LQQIVSSTRAGEERTPWLPTTPKPTWPRTAGSKSSFWRIDAVKLPIRLRAWDIAAVIVSILATVAFSVYAYGGKEGGQVVIESGGQTWIYALDQERSVDIPGSRGETRIQIMDGKARVVDSPCPDKLCVLSGAIDSPGQWIACLPNGVMLRIGGGSPHELDDVSF